VLTGDILVSSEGCEDGRAVRETDPIVHGRREEALEKRDGGVKDDGALSACLDANVDLVVVDEVGAHALDRERRRGVEVHGAQQRAELVRLDLVKGFGRHGGGGGGGGGGKGSPPRGRSSR
jgi:hypothetical protein